MDTPGAPQGALLPLAALRRLEDLSLGPGQDMGWDPTVAGNMAEALLSEPGFGAALTRLALACYILPSLPHSLLGMERLCQLELSGCELLAPGEGSSEVKLEHSLQVCGWPFQARKLPL